VRVPFAVAQPPFSFQGSNSGQTPNLHSLWLFPPADLLPFQHPILSSILFDSHQSFQCVLLSGQSNQCSRSTSRLYARFFGREFLEAAGSHLLLDLAQLQHSHKTWHSLAILTTSVHQSITPILAARKISRAWSERANEKPPTNTATITAIFEQNPSAPFSSMPSSRSLNTPSLEKHYNTMDNRRGGRFSFGHIIGDPFALATISIAIVSCQGQAGQYLTY
jgi:hypothetical protein